MNDSFAAPSRSSAPLLLVGALLLGPVASLGFAQADPKPPAPAKPSSSAGAEIRALEERFGALQARAPEPGELAALAQAARSLAFDPVSGEGQTRLIRDRARYLVARIALLRAKSGEEDQEERALAAFRALTEGGVEAGREVEPAENEWLRHFAFLGLVESLASSDPRQALELAEDLCAIDWWYSPKAVLRASKDQDAEARATLRAAVDRDREHLRRVCREAHTLRARLLIARGQPGLALQVVASLEGRPHGRGWRDLPGSIELVALGARARVEGGEIEEGVRELVRALEALDPKSSPAKGASNADTRRVGALQASLARGCVALAELAAVGEGVLRTPAACFYAGYGQQTQGEAGRSLHSYRRVLYRAQTPKERARWIPRAAREVGAQLFGQERYLEAALAYELVCREFPDHPFAMDAARYASSALKRAGKQLGNPPGGTIWDFRRRVEASVGQLLSPQAALRTRLAELGELCRAGRWSQAAEGYAAVAGGQADSRLRVRVLTEAGRSAWRAYREPPERQRDPRALASSRTHLREAVRVAEARGWIEEEAGARRRLAMIEGDLNNLIEVLELLEPFESRLQGASEAFAARQLQARAYLGQGGPQAADAAERAFAAAGPGVGDARARFAYELVSRLRSWGEARASQSGQPAERREARRRAARYAAIYLEAARSPEGSLSGVRLDVLSYLARVCSEGGAAEPALQSAEAALARAKATGSPRARAKLERLRALALASLNREAGIAALRTECRRGVLRARRQRASEPVVLVARTQSEETYPKVENGRTRQVKVWHLILQRGGEQEVWVQKETASAADTRFVLIPGRDPNALVRNSEVRVLELTQARDLELLTALEGALWARFHATGQRRLLTEPGGLSEVLAKLLGLVRGASDSGYLGMVSRLPRGTFLRSERLWEVTLSCLRLKLARQQWGQVESEIQGFELLGKLKGVSPEVRAELERLRALARAKTQR